MQATRGLNREASALAAHMTGGVIATGREAK
jgi:hypothetical protein